jgi:TIR domain
MSHDIFISYSKLDKAIADALCAVLEANGIRCWIAPRDVMAGVDWGEAIVKAIGGCRVMVLVFSSHANESPQVRREVQRAFERGLIVVPLRVEDVSPVESLEYYIGPVHWLDALTLPLERHLQSLAAQVQLLLKSGIPSAGTDAQSGQSPPSAKSSRDWTETFGSPKSAVSTVGADRPQVGFQPLSKAEPSIQAETPEPVFTPYVNPAAAIWSLIILRRPEVKSSFRR